MYQISKPICCRRARGPEGASLSGEDVGDRGQSASDGARATASGTLSAAPRASPRAAAAGSFTLAAAICGACTVNGSTSNTPMRRRIVAAAAAQSIPARSPSPRGRDGAETLESVRDAVLARLRLVDPARTGRRTPSRARGDRADAPGPGDVRARRPGESAADLYRAAGPGCGCAGLRRPSSPHCAPPTRPRGRGIVPLVRAPSRGIPPIPARNTGRAARGYTARDGTRQECRWTRRVIRRIVAVCAPLSPALIWWSAVPARPRSRGVRRVRFRGREHSTLTTRKSRALTRLCGGYSLGCCAQRIQPHHHP